jgi:two-component system sensor histidine kinase BaeS
VRSLRARLSVAFVVLAVLTTALSLTLGTYTWRTLFRQYVEQRQQAAQARPGTEEPLHRFGAQERVFQTRVREAIWGGTAVSAGLGVLLALWLAGRIARPVSDLTRAARAIAGGRGAPPVAVSGHDEIAELGRAFNRMAAQLAADEQQRRRLFAGITHELRTPLAVIQGTLEGMLDHVIEPTPERIAGLHGQTLLLRRLITDLRDLSLAQAGQLELHPRPVDMATLVSDAIEAFAPSFQDRGIAVEMSVPDALPPLDADPDRLRQVVQNLVDNALRYTPPGGTVRITLGADNGDVRLAVADTGQGIGSGDLPHIFEHFYRTDESRARSSGGTGLGLAIVKSLVEAHHGRVIVDSRPGAGTTFTVTLPARLRGGA